MRPGESFVEQPVRSLQTIPLLFRTVFMDQPHQMLYLLFRERTISLLPV